MAEEKKELWLKLMPATTVVFAVCATLCTFKGGGFSSKSVLTQAKASDQWAYYQAKGIKLVICEQQKENLELNLHDQKDPAYIADLEKRIIADVEKIKKYTTDKDTIEAQAHALEAQQADAKNHADTCGFGVIFLQISILFSSIAALVKKSPLWYLSLAVGIAGIVEFIDGLFLFW